MRPNATPTEDRINEELDFINGRIVTKVISREDYKMPASIHEATTKLDRLIFNRDRYLSLTDAVHYETFQIPKRTGGFRTIEAPTAQLKATQREIVTIMQKELKVLPHNAVHGFTPHRNCKTSLQVHQKFKSRWFLKLDIKDFFTNTTMGALVSALDNYANTSLLRTLHMREFVTLTTLDGRLPQGAPTSPLLANLAFMPKDLLIYEYCKQHGLIYTRYADDILISSRVEFNWQEVVAAISEYISPTWQLKVSKIRYGNFNGRNWNLGIMYNNKYELTIGHVKKNELKVRVHKYLLNPTDEEKYKLIGLIGYAKYIEPTYQKYDVWLSQLNTVTTDPGITE